MNFIIKEFSKISKMNIKLSLTIISIICFSLLYYFACNEEEFGGLSVISYDTNGRKYKKKHKYEPVLYQYIHFLYYSLIIQSTIGLGDILPLTNKTRLITGVQSIISLLIIMW